MHNFNFSALIKFCILALVTSTVSLWESSGDYHFLDSLQDNGSNGTCVYITFLDQFGDGWGANSSLYYWAEEVTSTGKVVEKTYILNLTTCNSTMVYGCLPSFLDVDHMTHLKLVTIDEKTGVEFVPPYFWEILWRVQLIYQHNVVGEYYGGFDTTFVFRYLAEDAKYVLVLAENRWVFPETAGNNLDSCNDEISGLGDCRVKKTGECTHLDIVATGSVDNTDVMGTDQIYQSIGWYISDNDAPTFYNLHDYGMPWSSTTTSPVSCSVCLPDGSYTFRTTGSTYHGQTLTWAFCGTTGTTQTHMEFTVINGLCYPSDQRDLGEICDGGLCKQHTKTSTDVVNLITGAAVTNYWMEGGFTEATDTSWIIVSTIFNDFHNAAVFISLPDIPGETSSEGYPAIARICDVAPTGRVSFHVRIFQANDTFCSKQWRVPRAINPPVRLSWLVVEKGAFNLAGNYFMIGSGDITRLNSDVTNPDNYIRYNYPSGCGGPTVVCAFPDGQSIGFIAQLQTLVYSRLLIPRGFNIQRRFLKVVLQPHDSSDLSYYAMPLPETLAYMAFRTGLAISCVEKMTFETKSFENVTHIKFDFHYQYLYDVPPGVYGIVGTAVSLADSTGLRAFDRTQTGGSIITQEDQCVDQETSHTTGERVYAMIVGQQYLKDSCVVCKAVFTPDPVRSAYPTPAPTPAYKSPTYKPTFAPTPIPVAPATPAPTCLHYDAALCTSSGECSGNGYCNNGYCVCTDMNHYWPRERCSTYHDGPQLAPGQFCNPNVNNIYCSYMGVCNSLGTECICNEPPHRYSSERCAQWHSQGEQSPTPSPLAAGVTVAPTPAPNICYTYVPTPPPALSPTRNPSAKPVVYPTPLPSPYPSPKPVVPTPTPAPTPNPSPNPVTPAPTCLYYDAATCTSSGECGSGYCNNGWCVCSDMNHYWPRERCSTYHDGPQLAPGQFCNPDVNNVYCSYLGVCNSLGTECICNEPPHRYSSERCAVWHNDAQQSPTPSPLAAGVTVAPTPAPNICYTCKLAFSIL
jgi:hypothetical protein